MTKEEIIAVEQQQRALVVKSNKLIQQSRFELSTQQQKILLYTISKIQPHDDEFQLYKFSIAEFCQVCGIDEKNGGNYHAVKKAIGEILEKYVWVRLENGKEVSLRWIEKAYMEEKSGIIEIKLDADMRPFLLQLNGGNFTKYELINTVNFKSKYSIRLYELIKSIHYNELLNYERIIEMEELKERMSATTYAEWRDFRRRAFEPAIEEINAYSDKTIEYEPIKTARFVTHIKLRITTKDYIDAMKAQRGW